MSRRRFLRSPLARFVLLVVSTSAAGSTLANTITGRNAFVCTAWQAMSCSTSDECKTTEAWRLNLPDFVRVDLRAQEFSTLPGSDEMRTTPIASITRTDGLLFLSGSQQDRGFTWVINEDTGEGTMAIVTDTTVISLFTACAATEDLQ